MIGTLARCLILFLILIGSQAVFGVNLKSQDATSSAIKNTYPQGSTLVPMLYMRFIATSNVALDSIVIRNDGHTTKFGSGITNAYLVLDDDDATLESDELASTPVSSITNFSSGASTQQTFFLSSDANASALVTGNVRSFFLLYDIESSASIGSTANATLVTANIRDDYGGTTVDADLSETSAANLSQTVTISGFATQNITSIAPTAAVNGDTNVGMLKLDIGLSGEALDSDTISIVITNSPSNTTGQFDNDGDGQGVTKVTLYKDTGDGIFSSTTDTQLVSNDDTNATFVSATEFRATLNTSLAIGDHVFFVAYDIGTDTPLDPDAALEAQLTQFSGTGSTSGETLSVTTPQPGTPASTAFAGLSIFGVFDMSSERSGNLYGPGTSIPVTKVDIVAYNTPATLNELVISNTGDVGFVVEKDTSGAPRTDAITKVSIFEDNGDRNYDDDGSDTLVGSVLFDGDSFTASQVSITLNNVLIPSFNAQGTTSQNQNIKQFFIEYDIGASVQVGTGNETVSAIVANGTGAADITSMTLPLQNIPGDPGVTVSLTDTNVVLISTADYTPVIAPTSAIRGQTKVPAFAFKLRADTQLSNAIFTISDIKSQLFENSEGIDKIWLYQDNESTTDTGSIINSFDSTDTFLTVIDTFPDNTQVSLSAVTIPQGDTLFLVLFDVGQAATIQNASNVELQLTSMSSSDDSISLGGTLPFPASTVGVEFLDRRVTATSVGISQTTITPTDTGVTASVTITNTHSSAVTINALAPRVYAGGANGTDISSELGFATTQTFPVSLGASSALNVVYTLSPTSLTSQTSGLLDLYADYVVSGSYTATIERYQDSPTSYTTSVASPINLTLSGEATQSNIPAYVSTITLDDGSTAFRNGDAITSSDGLIITFKDPSNIDESTLTVSITNSSGTTLTTLSDTVFTYNNSTGVLTILAGSLGSGNGSVTIAANDSAGNSLVNLSLSFKISSSVSVSDVLVYPNPFNTNANIPLRVGYNITTAATVTIDIYNMRGKRVYRATDSVTAAGYHTHFVASSGSLASGVYLVRLSAEDNNGNKSRQKTKLAVY